MDSSQPTQPATQQVDDSRKLGRRVSDISHDDLSDVICILHPQTAAAIQAIPATMQNNPQHILQNDDLQGITRNDLLQSQFQDPRDIALRMSSDVKSPADGFVFGRSPSQCDVLLTQNAGDSLVSQRHFKIYVNSQGSLMIQDLSTNGTIVDDDVLRCKPRHGVKRPSTRVLKNGTIIGVISGHRVEVKFFLRIPNRGDYEDAYEQGLRKYLEQRGTVANFASMRESAFGNVWNGGSIYSFTGNLGKGAFATVYRVQTKRDGIMYAAKEIDKRRFKRSNGQLDIRFDNELRIMQSLRHPNIVQYVDSHTHGDHIYIIMECMSGGELQSELRARGFLPESEVQQIARQILQALRYLHRRGITHRDIKPDNILIASRRPLVVKLSDFGLSKCISNQETFLKTFCGTLLYCAPEVYPEYGTYAEAGTQPKRRRAGEHTPKKSPYSEAVDMWSFGAVLFHLLCGKPPYMGSGDNRGPATMLSDIMTKEVDFGRLRAAGVSENCIRFVSLLLKRNPHVRPNEEECLAHAWLRAVPDLFQYEEDGPDPDTIRRELDAIEEAEDEDEDEDEDGFQMLKEVKQFNQPAPHLVGGHESEPSLSPDWPHKKPRRENEEELGSSPEVSYPALPSLPPTPVQAANSAPAPQDRLFGEITNSAMPSSGVFGVGVEAPVIIGVEDATGQDFRNHGPGPYSSDMSYENVSLAQFPVPPPLPTPTTPKTPTREEEDENAPGSAASLLGAEKEIGELRVGSPNPPRMGNGNDKPKETGECDSPTRSANRLHESENCKPSRQMDTAGATAHEESGLEGETRQQKENKTTERSVSVQSTGIGGLQSPTIRLDEKGFTKPARRFGRLSSLPGSIANITIHLEERGTTWGRSPACTHQYEDVKDTRIPKLAMRVIFWAPGMEAHEKRGGDWTQMANIQTVISTSASAGIRINGYRLTENSQDGRAAALYGKIYTGDIITVYESSGSCDSNHDNNTTTTTTTNNHSQSEFLKFKVEITFGSSAGTRPAGEQPFQVQRERKFYSEYVQRGSMRRSMQEKDPNAAVASKKVVVAAAPTATTTATAAM